MLPGPPNTSMYIACYFSRINIIFFSLISQTHTPSLSCLLFPSQQSTAPPLAQNKHPQRKKYPQSPTHSITQQQPSTMSPFTTLAAVAATTIAVPVAIPLVVGAVGFGAGGIVAGSWAASFMATYGGTVAVGSACATLQSIGAAGLGVAGTAIAGVVGGAAAGAAAVGADGFKSQ
ncbi:MAG: hypothetical protein JOS17DRAFT_553652 [Linnemannia elongata]|nr:MAG: hypothetical protein JOS17DRAFT_553652 [Linnemannia elongata]